MDEYIKRSDAMAAFPTAKADVFENCRNCTCLDSDQINAILQGVPIADVRPVVRGEWSRSILDGIPGHRPIALYCSRCNAVAPWPTNYCPNCGADMREETE